MSSVTWSVPMTVRPEPGGIVERQRPHLLQLHVDRLTRRQRFEDARTDRRLLEEHHVVEAVVRAKAQVRARDGPTKSDAVRLRRPIRDPGQVGRVRVFDGSGLPRNARDENAPCCGSDGRIGRCRSEAPDRDPERLLFVALRR
jgi:hypothetical protein